MKRQDYINAFSRFNPSMTEYKDLMYLVWGDEKSGMGRVAAWKGKAQKPFANYSFRTEAGLFNYIENQKREADKRCEQKEADKKAHCLAASKKYKKFCKGERPSAKCAFVPGAILVNIWGWEQTNIDFYVIVERSGMFVKVLPMTKESAITDRYGMSKKNAPSKINWDAKPERKKIQCVNGEEKGFSFGNYMGAGWCKLWNGEKKTSTHYA